MSLEPKRRRFSIYTLPVVVGIGFLAVASLASWQRSDLIADLADRIAHGEPREAIDAVHKLAAMPSPPLPILVTAAACDDHETADVAQLAISRLLRRWQRDIEMKRRESEVARGLSELAQTLAEKLGDFSDTDHVWLATTARKILTIANKFPFSKTPLVAIHCDAILSSVGDGGPVTPDGTPIVDGNNPAATHADREGAESAAVISEHDSGRAELERTFSGFAPQPFTDGNQPIGQSNENSGPLPGTSDRLDTADSESDTSTPNDLPDHGGLSNDDGWQIKPRNVASQNGTPSPPILRILPVTPANTLPIEDFISRSITPISRPASPSLGIVADDSLAHEETRELLRRWLDPENKAAQTIEHELAKRGFGKLSKRIVKQFFAENADERMRLVDDVLAQPGAGSGAWLLLLADDANADVRLFAVTLMATSNDAALVEKAWQVAIRDHDPRIADLAAHLRERRTGTFRR